jgi:hypothetical protein
MQSVAGAVVHGHTTNLSEACEVFHPDCSIGDLPSATISILPPMAYLD